MASRQSRQQQKDHFDFVDGDKKSTATFCWRQHFVNFDASVKQDSIAIAQ